MKIQSLVVLSSAFLAAPAIAGVSHDASLAHEGTTISVKYEPRIKTGLRQSGLGPRNSATCLWTTEISVERKLADASGRPIEALTRTVGEPKVIEGMQPGYCAHVKRNGAAVFGGNSSQMQAFLAQAAVNDKDSLNTELASVGSLGRQVSR